MLINEFSKCQLKSTLNELSRELNSSCDNVAGSVADQRMCQGNMKKRRRL